MTSRGNGCGPSESRNYEHTPFFSLLSNGQKIWWANFYHQAIKKKKNSTWAIWEWHSPWWKKTEVNSYQLYVLIASVHQRDKTIDQRFSLYHCQLYIYKMNRFKKNHRSFQFHFHCPLISDLDYIILPFKCRPRERILLLMRNRAQIQGIQIKPKNFQACRIPFNFMSI